MNNNSTPLRYPGGKSMMSPFFIDLIKANKLNHITYAEPYAGGAGTAINLLLGGYVDDIIINDYNVCIYSFWHYILTRNNQFIKKIQETDICLEEWKKQKNILRTKRHPCLDLAFATFFLSRTNRSGILNAGPIGGNSEEKQKEAKYKIDCRFNKVELIERIRKIGNFKKHIRVLHKDAIDFLKYVDGDNLLIYLDPPYYEKGKSLYLNYYENNDHQQLANFLANQNKFRWVLSYNKVDAIVEMYKSFDLYEFSLKYTAQKVKDGSELLTHSRDLIMPGSMQIERKGKNILIKKII